jgi:hypothetical protein
MNKSECRASLRKWPVTYSEDTSAKDRNNFLESEGMLFSVQCQKVPHLPLIKTLTAMRRNNKSGDTSEFV